MKRTLHGGGGVLLYASLLLAAFVFVGCEKPESVGEPSVTEQFEKIETKYREGDVRIENVAGEKKRSVASKETLERIKRETAELRAANEKRYSSKRTIFGGYDVGVIPETPWCPAWSEYVHFYLDNENSSPATTGGGWVGAWIANDPVRNTHMVYCRVDGRLFPDNVRYSVLALGNQRADAFEGTSEMYIDSEDGSNSSYSEGDIYPNIVTNNTILYLHTSNDPGTSITSTTFPDFQFRYAVFGTLQGGITYGWVATDDEDSNNANKIDPYSGQSVSYYVLSGGSPITLLSSHTEGVHSYRDQTIPGTTETSGSRFDFVVVRN